MKTKRILSLIVATVMLVSLLAVVGLVNAFAATPIATAEEFMSTFSGKETVTGNYTLTASITLPDGYVTPASFSGTLDGGKNTVSGIKTPLFDTLSGEVKNLTLGSPKSESSISSDATSPIGALANITLYAETVSNGRVAADRITVTAGPSLNSKEGCEKLFDGTTSTKFYKRQYSEGSVPAVREPMDAIFFKTDVAVTITHFNMINGNDTASHTGRIPSAWTLYGSEDGKTYVVIDSETDPELTTDNYAVHGFTVDNPGSYQYYKLVFVCGDDGNVQFSEMELYETVS